MKNTRRTIETMLSLLLTLLNASGQSKGEDELAEEAGQEWSASLSVTTYLAQHGRDFTNPVLSADHGALHLEARYNYEAIKTGSLWAGYNFSTGDKLAISITPMLGFVFGDLTGLAPGYNLSLAYQHWELATQGEYVFDAGTHSGNFFYTWSELSYAPVGWFRLGMVVDRTKVLGSGFDVRRGPLLGFSHDMFDFTAYWLDPGSADANFVFAVTINF